MACWPVYPLHSCRMHVQAAVASTRTLDAADALPVLKLAHSSCLKHSVRSAIGTNKGSDRSLSRRPVCRAATSTSWSWVRARRPPRAARQVLGVLRHASSVLLSSASAIHNIGLTYNRFRRDAGFCKRGDSTRVPWAQLEIQICPSSTSPYAVASSKTNLYSAICAKHQA
jgi:hypothetical protein